MLLPHPPPPAFDRRNLVDTPEYGCQYGVLDEFGEHFVCYLLSVIRFQGRGPSLELKAKKNFKYQVPNHKQSEIKLKAEGSKLKVFRKQD
jgi:hypothetical protein